MRQDTSHCPEALRPSACLEVSSTRADDEALPARHRRRSRAGRKSDMTTALQRVVRMMRRRRLRCVHQTRGSSPDRSHASLRPRRQCAWCAGGLVLDDMRVVLASQRVAITLRNPAQSWEDQTTELRACKPADSELTRSVAHDFGVSSVPAPVPTQCV